jgi:hypothetical protein
MKRVFNQKIKILGVLENEMCYKTALELATLRYT